MQALSTKVAFAPRLSVARATSHTRRAFAVRAEGIINPNIQKDNPKVVDKIDSSTIDKQAVYCRCWLSGKFPLCDGTHAKHNAATGDNVGPLIVTAPQK